MSKTKSKDQLKPVVSLAQHFDPPEGFVGHFAWLCGYSADAAFMNKAADRFMCNTQADRAHDGRVLMALMLDPGNPEISMKDAPGVLHLGFLSAKEKPFRLLHAKVGILGFSSREKDDPKWHLRLLVSTGNWTRQTVEESLDLVWRIDVSSEDLEKADSEVIQNCSDIKAAWSLFQRLQPFFDARLLSYKPHSFNKNSFEAWINECAKLEKDKQPRFFDSWDASIMQQLPQKIKSTGDGARAYLAMGSGFYEGSDVAAKNSVPVQIVGRLRKSGLITDDPEIDVYVNRNSCQAIAGIWEELRDEYNITVRPASVPETVFRNDQQRSLHAKFLLGASQGNTRASWKVKMAWVYIGSSNLTNPGFLEKMSPSEGNLEAGVLFAPGDMVWLAEGATEELPSLMNLLPIQWEHEIEESNPPMAGDKFEERVALYVAPPIACLQWSDDGALQPVNQSEDLAIIKEKGVQIVAPEAEIIDFDEVNKAFPWPNKEQPRDVKIRWLEGREITETSIPVMDAHGRLVATPLKPIDSILDLQWQLENFPLLLDSEAEESGGLEQDEESSEAARVNIKKETASYPIRSMMAMIEKIASQQTEVVERDWAHWCHRLECLLKQAKDSEEVKYFRDTLKINPLSSLKFPAFLPVFAEDPDSDAWCRYGDALRAGEEAWGVKDLKGWGSV